MDLTSSYLLSGCNEEQSGDVISDSPTRPTLVQSLRLVVVHVLANMGSNLFTEL